jgi:hypothetical protein
MSNKNKNNKKKTVYVDDGRTIADMSSLGGPRLSSTGKKGTLKDQFNTYKNAVKMMFVPMLVTLGIITVAYLIMYILLL